MVSRDGSEGSRIRNIDRQGRCHGAVHLATDKGMRRSNVPAGHNSLDFNNIEIGWGSRYSSCVAIWCGNYGVLLIECGEGLPVGEHNLCHLKPHCGGKGIVANSCTFHFSSDMEHVIIEIVNALHDSVRLLSCVRVKLVGTIFVVIVISTGGGTSEKAAKPPGGLC